MVDAERRSGSAVRRSIAAFVLTTLLALVIVGAAATAIARTIAEDGALAEATRVAATLRNVLFEPALPKILAGDAAQIDELGAAVDSRRQAGVLAGITLWSRDGTVVYSDDPAERGRRFPPPPEVRLAIDDGASSAKLARPGAAAGAVSDPAGELVEVYLPLAAPDGRNLAFQVSSPDTRVAAAETGLVGRLVPFALLSLLLLVVVQLPVAVFLIRRVSRAQEERSRLLRSALTASQHERRAIAGDLHDGVVQDLAGVGYALEAATRSLPENTPSQAHRLVAKATGVLQQAVRSLRTLMVDIYPPNLDGAGMPGVLEELADRLRSSGVDVTVDVALRTGLSPEIAATVYRCARECVTNIGKHAGATRAWITLTDDAGRVSLVVRDDGVGLPPDAFDRPPDGHLGMQLLRDSLTDLGGTMTTRQPDGAGAEIRVDLPLDPATHR